MRNRNAYRYRDIVSTDRTTPVLNRPITRREFLVTTGVIGGTLLMGAGTGAVEREIFPENALGMVIGDPTRCVGCGRCELACSEFNDGKAQPSIARIKVGRNYNFGPMGIQKGLGKGEGIFGNHRIIQDICRQCPHPVPCQLACPYDAIEVVPPLNARVINIDKCQGCRICQQACPWGMISFDEEINKATKCHLCNGDPECVKACPSGALRYLPWKDMTKQIPARFVRTGFVEIPKDVQGKCGNCH